MRVLGLLILTACAAPSVGEYPNENDSIALPNRKESGESSSAQSDGPKVTLTVTLDGIGKIVSSPPGLTCAGASCTGKFDKDTVVTLQATPPEGTIFGGWSGACTGAAACAPKVTGDTTLGAKFVSIAGSWKGTYTNVRPASGCTFTNAGDLTVVIDVAPSSRASMTGLELRALALACRVIARKNGTSQPSPLTSANGTFTGTWEVAVEGTTGTLAFPFTATIEGTTMTGAWTCPNCTGSFTLTRQ
jgi:hypothetical protein